ncbi:methyltransferase [Actinoplanes sp. NPDC049548]|uniref:methyltransferase n=1 Tax=Actinoplanes sp. NPDC049548 TaxID=3155152 RepID=UPI00344497F2
MSNVPVFDSGHGARLREGLRGLYDRRYDLFHRAFALGLPVTTAELDGLGPALEACGLAQRKDDEWRCGYRIARMADDFLVTDPPAYSGRDRVLYLSDNESLLLARTLPRCDGLRVLDLGSGSGVQAVAARRRGARSVTSIDISPRAVAMTRFNLALNGLPDDDVQLTGLTEHAPAEPYDVLINNPPFVPVPPDTAFMTSGAGGVDGLDFVRLLVRSLPRLVHDRSTVCLVSLSPGTRHLSELETLLLDYAAGRPMRLRTRRVFDEPSPIADSLAPFEGYADLDRWAGELADRGHTHLHNLLVTLEPAGRASMSREALSPPVELHPGNLGSTDWAGLYAEIRLALTMAQ